tara:strand:+ start:7031 stop:8734 length:1704 start_codon:yes stop_codon:yes gene_type:complete
MSEQKNNRKIGLALSGGGFRASFYHIGVLARLAEIGWLSKVEAISTVSGGSIVGALYYLHLKKLFESKTDENINKDDYIDVVNNLEKEFFDGVEKNIRIRTFSNLINNLKMFRKNYSRSDRLGELYEKLLYKLFVDPAKKRIRMRDLKIRPKGHMGGEEFHPKNHNSSRTNKVPILLLNATALNTGHNWQFTASWMGEPDRGLPDIDKNMRLRRLYYDEAPIERLKNISLGVAVAASAGVPGLFPPMAISELYPDITVELVDGGVHDNQGVEGLFDEKCNYIMCSDASGQMADDKEPGDGILSVLPRSNSILMDRVREAELISVKKRKKTGDLKGFKFVHLKRGLIKPEITWLSGEDKANQVKDVSGVTSYGVDRNVQRLLSNIRTDLDSFTEVEAYSLILSGYLMTEKEFQGKQPDDKLCDFHHKCGKLKKLMEKPSNPYQKQLKIGSSLFLKAFKSVLWLKILGLTVVAVALGLLIILMWPHIDESIPGIEYLKSWKTLIIALVTAFLPIVLMQIPGIRWIYYYRILKNVFLQAWIAFFGFLFSWCHLWLTDPVFKKQGRLKQLR